MSIDRQWDIYLENTGITPAAEVVPDHACQVFDATPAPGDELNAARELVRTLLQEP
ncbi:hypothetical protein [Corynebacterium sp.]|uniref:hypothetical protein n=1 Tax=Corynebacterium sp. TaxID=1720 RepID=UPI0026DFA344|nr:hypothetical protein [Corynebacterium sp.]MDO5513370.1 hypothetical protein [Corynebacterium sp.]